MKRLLVVAFAVACGPAPTPPVRVQRPAAAMAAVSSEEAAGPAQPRFVLQTGHVLPVNDVAWSPDGSALATAGGDGVVKVWDAATGVVRGTVAAGARGTWSVTWSPHGDRLAAASADGTVHVSSVVSGALLYVAETNGSALSVDWSPDGRRLATAASGGVVEIWDASSGARESALQGHTGSVDGVAWSPDGSRIASAGADGSVRTWDGASGAALETWPGPGPALERLAWSPDGSRIAAGGRGPRVRIWDTRNGRAIRTLEGHERAAADVAWSPDGRRVATAGWDRTVRLWDAATGETVRTLQGHEGFVGAVAFSPDGRRLASASTDDTVRVWDVASGASVVTLAGRDERITSVHFQGESLLLASGLGGVGRVWDLATGRIRRTVRSSGRSMESAAWNADGSLVAAPGPENVLEIRNAATGAVTATLRGHHGPVVVVAWSPDGRTVATGSADASIRLWDVATGAPGRVLEGHRGYVQALAWSPDGKSLASGSGDRGVRIWDVALGVGTELGSHDRGVSTLRWSPDGTAIASGSGDGTVRIWDVAGRSQRAVLAGHVPAVSALAWSPDGTAIATAALDGRVRIWDAASGTERSAFGGDAGAVLDVAWSPSGKILAVAGSGILLRRVDDGASVWLRSFDVAGREVGLVHTEDGLFAGDDEAFGRVHFRAGTDLLRAEIVTADQLFESHHRPDLLPALLGGRPIRPDGAAAEDLAPAPTVEFVDPPGPRVETARVRIRVRAVDRGGGVAAIRIFVNGARADDGRGGGFSAEAPAEGGIEKTVEVVLLPGDNEISAEGISERGRVEGRRATLRLTLGGAAAGVVPPALHVLAVTVDEYANPTQRLAFANEDGDAIVDVLRRLGRPFASVNVHRLKDAEATKDRILALGERLRAEVRPGDTFVFYLAGHGMLARCADGDAQRYFFATHPARLEPRSLCDVGLSALDVAGVLRRVPAQRQLLVLDTCQSAGAIDDLWTEVDLLKRLAREHGVAILAASKATEVAGEVADLGHGLFTHVLLEGLRGHARVGEDREVSAYGLLAYMGREVDALSMQYFRRPQTVIASAQGRDFPLASPPP